MENIKSGMTVHGVLKFQGGPFKKWIPDMRSGRITRITETGFWVKYDGIISEIQYSFNALGKMVFTDKESCEYETDRANNPGFKEIFGKKAGSSQKS